MNNESTSRFYEYLKGRYEDGQDGIAVSKTSAALYTRAGKPVSAIKLYFLNPYISKHSAHVLVDRLVKAKKAFDEDPVRSSLSVKREEKRYNCG